MRKFKNYKIWLIGFLSVLLTIATVQSFIYFVNDRLWEKSVTDIMEVSTQGLGKLEKGLEKEFYSLRNLSAALEDIEDSSIEENRILNSIQQDEHSYFVINMTKGIYNNSVKQQAVSYEDLKKLEQLTQEGISDPYYEAVTGIKVLSLYRTFTYKNGSKGIILKEIPLNDMAKEYTLSFYNNTGFSYIMKTDGTILIRAMHRNSNRTFQNLSEIINYGGNEQEDTDSIFQAMKEKKRGIAILSDHNQRENVFCYMPVGETKDWYLMSIIPKQVIDKQANEIISLTLLLCLGMLLVISVIVLIYIRTSHKHREEIKQMAYYDKLTGLYNFEQFKVLGRKILEEKATLRIATVYLDIQEFKAINDIQGYEYGDELLRNIASNIQVHLNKDSIAARVSADNFLLLCCSADVQEVHDMIENLLDKIDGTSKGYHIKMGICVMKPDEELSINQMIDRARLAHRNAKKRENNCIVYNDSMREKMIDEAKIEAVMEDALKNDEFVAYLQPKYNVEGNQIKGAEALVRWIDADGNMRATDSFIPLFEKNGFITKIDTYIFETVCKLMRCRMDQGKDIVPISVNVSRVHLFQDDFISKYEHIKESYHIPDKMLILEVTETIIAESVTRLHAIITRLHDAGFEIAIDDFGSGYSSLNILKELPVDVIKLDREFFSYVEDEKRAEVIINNIVKMVNELHIRSVAEGVETKKQLDFLKQAGCDLIQGYIYARPMPIQEFIDRFDAQHE